MMKGETDSVASGRRKEDRVTIAATVIARMRGLLGTRSCEGSLVIAPCSGVHTCGMRYPIDLAFADRSGRIVLVRRSLKPNRSVACGKAVLAIERQADAEKEWFAVGDALVLAAVKEDEKEESDERVSRMRGLDVR